MSQQSRPQPGASPTSKAYSRRVHRSSRNRPVLVTPRDSAMTAETDMEIAEQPVQTIVETEIQPEVPNKSRRLPTFFANIGRSDKNIERSNADPIAARIARATRGKVFSSALAGEQTEKKEVSPSRNGAPKPARATSGFKTRYLWGMVLYLLIADVLGLYVTNFIRAQGWDASMNIGPIPLQRSTLIFLALLVIILLVMARLDLIPRSFGAMKGSSATPAKSSKGSSDATFESKASQPTVKQGVQGSDDELYQEYRQNQRYFQKRDRKR